MKAYFINAKDELIVETDVKDYYHKLELLDCRMLELYPYSVNGNDIWTDEEGNLKARFFNKENEYQYFGDDIGYTQGMGVSYEIDFNDIKTLFKNKNKKRLNK